MDNEFKVLEDKCSQPGTAVERDGVHFGYYASGEIRPELILYRKGSQGMAAVIPFPESSGPGGLYTMKVRFNPGRYEYNFREGGQIITDPRARKIAGRREFGAPLSTSPHQIRGGFITREFSWEADRRPEIPYEDAVMYHLHVRGFTKQNTSGVKKKGTFAGVIEKLPYLQELGINQIKLMPAYEFPEIMAARIPNGMPSGMQPDEAGMPDDRQPDGPETLPRGQFDTPDLSAKKQTDEKRMVSAGNGSEQQSERTSRNPYTEDFPLEKPKLNYWGYGPGYYFAPKASYAAGADPDVEFKELVKAAHCRGIEVLMEFSFPDETDIFTMKECLAYWATEYHVDGFHILSRDSVWPELSRLPLFRELKLICGWLPEQTLEYNRTKGFRRLAVSNNGFMDDCRRSLKGDERALEPFSQRIRQNPPGCAVINYITNHDGFTLADLVSYDRKYNLENGEQDRDGSDYNNSWNCGVEGPTKKKAVLKLRMRQRKNAFAILLFSQGTPMLLAGDEFGNTQNGNNNPYCHDSPLTWLDWNRRGSSRELTEFVKSAIAYRKAHRVLHQAVEPKCFDSQADGFPDLSYHGDWAWYCDFEGTNRHIGCMYSGRCIGEKGFLYIAYNFHWIEQEFALPYLPKETDWYKVMDTSLEKSFLEAGEQENMGDVKSFRVPPRTIMILEGRENETDKRKKSDHMGKDQRTLPDDHRA